MKPELIEQHATELFAALRGRRTLPPLTERLSGIRIEDAYRISLATLALREADGERVIGKKIGATSKAVQDMLDIQEPDFGFLTDRMQVADGSTVNIAAAGLIQPRAEGEIAFVLKQDLLGPDISAADVLRATDYVLPCFEIVDSRIDNWRIRIQDTVADNASCGVFVLGAQRTDPFALDLAAAELTMTRNGQACGSGLGSAVQGHPATAVAWLANTLGAFGIPFRRGEVILSGSLAPLVPVAPGDRFEMRITGLGGASVAFAA